MDHVQYFQTLLKGLKEDLRSIVAFQFPTSFLKTAIVSFSFIVGGNCEKLIALLELEVKNL